MSKIGLRSVADIDQERKHLSDRLAAGAVSASRYAALVAELDDIESLLGS